MGNRLKKWTVVCLTAAMLIGGTAIYSTPVAYAEEGIYFPDANLKRALIANGVDANKDGQITKEEMALRADPNHIGTGLDKLRLNGYNITDLTGIEYAVNVRSLELHSNPLTNLSPLREMKQLELITLAETNVTDLSPLTGMTNMRLIDLHRSKVADLTPVSTMSGLKSIIISFTNVSDIGPLAGLRELISVSADSAKVSNLSALATLPYLREINFTNNRISDLSPLNSIQYLERVSLAHNQIASIAPLARQANLQYADLAENQIADVTPLQGLNKLNMLLMDDNQITDISALSELTQLNGLYLSKNKIGDLQPLSKLTQLKRLYLGGNQISNIQALAGLTLIEDLLLSDNRITDITPIGNMLKLRYLYLSNNTFTDMSVLSRTKELYELYIDGNPIKDYSVLRQLTKLVKLVADTDGKDQLKPGEIEVKDGGVYNHDVTINFDKGQATLNDKPIQSGTVISAEGSYALILTEVVGITKTINFRIDKTAPKITGVKDGGVHREELKVRFNEGEATLNGVKTPAFFWVDQFTGENIYELIIAEDGKYKLVVTDLAGNESTVSFEMNLSNSLVSGVSNNGVYNSKRMIMFKRGTATLNGQPFPNGGVVSEPGKYTLIITEDNGKVTTLTFTIQGTDNGGGTDESGTSVELKGVSSWAKDDISYAQRIGLSNPVEKANFSSMVTRQQFAAIALKLYEALTNEQVQAVGNNPFTDTSNVDVLKAYQVGIVNGTSKATFSPDALITREQLATMLKRVVDEARATLPKGVQKGFKDKQQFSPYAVDAINYLSAIDVVKGLTASTFGSKQNASIEQAVVMAKRIHVLAAEMGSDTGNSDNKNSNRGNGGTDSNSGNNGDGSNGGTPTKPEVNPGTAQEFGSGSMFARYVSRVDKQYMSNMESEDINIYALKNDQAFIMPAYSAIYVTVMSEGDGSPKRNNAKLLIANMTDQPKRIEAGAIQFSLEGLFKDNWGSFTNPDGTKGVVRSVGPYVNLAIFNGPADTSKSYYDLENEGNFIDTGSWFEVRYKKN